MTTLAPHNVIPFPLASLTPTESRAQRNAERAAAMARHPANGPARPTVSHAVAVTLAQRAARRRAKRRLMYAVRGSLYLAGLAAGVTLAAHQAGLIG